MKFTILIPHYKTGKMTAYAIHKLLKHKGRHEVDIVVIDNSRDFDKDLIVKAYNGMLWGSGSAIEFLEYPADRLQSHGIAFDYAIEQGLVNTEYFITIESDSFPTHDKWLDYYERLINEGYDMAGSLLTLSGGRYVHPCGAMYKLSNWREAMADIRQLYPTYHYQANCREKNGDGFKYHAMWELDPFNDPPVEDMRAILRYLPCTGVFHNGMGFIDEDVKAYGQRNIETGIANFQKPIPLPKLIHRVGYEPGQWFAYWHYWKGKKIKEIPTETVWLPNRRNQQQAYTLNEAGFKHLWGITAWHGSEAEDMRDVIEFKRQQAEELYREIGL